MGIVEYLQSLHPVLEAFLATCFTWGMTALGAAEGDTVQVGSVIIVIGAAAVMIARPILPYALAFAAGAMIFVVVEELIPESQPGGSTDLATIGTMAGFVVMTILDVGFG